MQLNIKITKYQITLEIEKAKAIHEQNKQKQIQPLNIYTHSTQTHIMSYNQSTPLLRHQLDSLLPYQHIPYPTKPTPKTHQFYKPQQFIWNNPHRTSDTIYKFYHKYNDKYETNKAPEIQKLEQQEKEEREKDRIRKLTQVRQETRQRFFTRQKEREQLEGLSGNRSRVVCSNEDGDLLPSTTPNLPSTLTPYPTALKRFSTVSHYHPRASKYQPMIPSHVPSKIPTRKSNTLLQNIEKTYLTGLQRSDNKRKIIETLIVSETHRHQDQLREDFERQKETNSKRMSQVTRWEGSKVDARSVYRQG